VWFVGVTGVEGNLVAAEGRDKKVSEIAVAGAGKMSMREAEDGGVFVAVSGSPFVALFEGADLGIGRELDHAEGGGGAGKGVSFRAGADHGINQLERVGCLREREGGDSECGHAQELFHDSTVQQRVWGLGLLPAR